MSFTGKTSTKSPFIRTNAGIPLGSSPRMSRPDPIILPPRRFVSIEEEEDAFQATEHLFHERVRAHQEELALAPIRANPVTIAIKEIVNLRRFDDPLLDAPAPLICKKLYLGDANHAMDICTLKKLGINAILNCASDACITDAAYYGRENFAYHEFAAKDVPHYQMASHIEEAREFFDLCMKEERAVLVHCAAGINRSAFIAIYLYMVATKTPLVKAVEHCFALRPIILCNESFINQLVEKAEKEGRI